MAMEATMEIERLFFFGLQGCVKGEPVALQRHSEKTKDRLGMKPQMRRWLGFIFFRFDRVLFLFCRPFSDNPSLFATRSQRSTCTTFVFLVTYLKIK